MKTSRSWCPLITSAVSENEKGAADRQPTTARAMGTRRIRPTMRQCATVSSSSERSPCRRTAVSIGATIDRGMKAVSSVAV